MDLQQLKSFIYKPKWYIQQSHWFTGILIVVFILNVMSTTPEIDGGTYFMVAAAILLASYTGSNLGEIARYDRDAAEDSRKIVYHAIEQWIEDRYKVRHVKPVDKGDVEAWLKRLEDGATEHIQLVLTDSTVHEYKVIHHDGKLSLQDTSDAHSLASLRKR